MKCGWITHKYPLHTCGYLYLLNQTLVLASKTNFLSAFPTDSNSTPAFIWWWVWIPSSPRETKVLYIYIYYITTCSAIYPWHTSCSFLVMCALSNHMCSSPCTVTNADIACNYDSYPIYPFAFRTHTHHLGKGLFTESWLHLDCSLALACHSLWDPVNGL